jgi:hypothetical protein
MGTAIRFNWLIDTRNTQDLNGKSITKIFECQSNFSVSNFYRYVRLTQTGKTSHGDDCLALTNIEFFGSIANTSQTRDDWVKLFHKQFFLNCCHSGLSSSSHQGQFVLLDNTSRLYFISEGIDCGVNSGHYNQRIAHWKSPCQMSFVDPSISRNEAMRRNGKMLKFSSFLD